MSQNSFQVPTSGTESAVTFAGQCNQAWLALASKNSGASTPANGPGSAALQFQNWCDTTNPTQVNWKIFDGTSWPRVGTIDTFQSIFIPKQGGGLGTATLAASIDIFAIKEPFITISGGTPLTTITSFGGSGEDGEWRTIHAGTSFIIANNANIACLGGTQLIMNAGDTCDVYKFVGGFARVTRVSNNGAPTGMPLPLGSVFWRYYAGDMGGALVANGTTIGSASSGAAHASIIYYNLFSILWNQGSLDPDMVVSGGRGASADADWTANKTITLPDLRGRTLFGRDTMGTGAAGRITVANPASNTTGATVGTEFITIAQANLPNVTLTTSIGSGQGSHTHTHDANKANGNLSVAGPGVPATQNQAATINSNTLPSMSGTTPSGGSGTAINVINPGKLGNWFIVI